MKNAYKLLGIAALAVTLALAACPSPSNSDGGGGETAKYTAKDSDGSTVDITFTRGGGRAALADGDWNYTVRAKGSVVSKGTVTVSGETLAFKPDSGAAFTGSLSGGFLSAPIPGVGVIMALEGSAAPVPKEYNVSTAANLVSTLESIKGTPGEHVLNLTGNVTNYPGFWINNPAVKITIKGNGNNIQWNPSSSEGITAFGVARGAIIFENLTISVAAGNTTDLSLISAFIGMIEIKGATLVGNNQSGGSGVWLLDSGAIFMSGGTIKNCDAGAGTNSAGGASIVISGGEITNCTRGVDISGKNSLLISGGAIKNSTEIGIMCRVEGTSIVIKGGEITGSTKHGIVLSNSTNTSVIFSGGTISKNGEDGVKLVNCTNTSFTMTGGTISGNTLWGLEIEASPNSGFSKTGGIIYGKTAAVATNANAQGAIRLATGSADIKTLTTDAPANCNATLNNTGNAIASQSGW